MTRSASRAASVGGLAATLLLACATMAPPARATHSGEDHWGRLGSDPRALVYIWDRTGPTWPVGSAVTDWNQAYPKVSARLNVYYRTSCPSSGHCIEVNDVNTAGLPAGCEPPPGEATQGCADVDLQNPDPYGVHHIEDADIWLNTQVATTTTQRRKTACHEIGHALGLALPTAGDSDRHRTTNNSCMTAGLAPPIAGVPDAHDFEALGNMYDHSI